MFFFLFFFVWAHVIGGVICQSFIFLAFNGVGGRSLLYYLITYELDLRTALDTPGLLDIPYFAGEGVTENPDATPAPTTIPTTTEGPVEDKDAEEFKGLVNIMLKLTTSANLPANLTTANFHKRIVRFFTLIIIPFIVSPCRRCPN